jgi:hypothetical protein
MMVVEREPSVVDAISQGMQGIFEIGENANQPDSYRRAVAANNSFARIVFDVERRLENGELTESQARGYLDNALQVLHDTIHNLYAQEEARGENRNHEALAFLAQLQARVDDAIQRFRRNTSGAR